MGGQHSRPEGHSPRISAWRVAAPSLARGIATANDIELVAGVSQHHSGRNLRDVFDEPALNCSGFASAEEALQRGCDVFVEHTKPEIARRNVLGALASGAHVVIGTSVGDRALCARRQARCAEWYRARTGVASGARACAVAHHRDR